jgi:hypothetical protein
LAFLRENLVIARIHSVPSPHLCCFQISHPFEIASAISSAKTEDIWDFAAAKQLIQTMKDWKLGLDSWFMLLPQKNANSNPVTIFCTLLLFCLIEVTAKHKPANTE